MVFALEGLHADAVFGSQLCGVVFGCRVVFGHEPGGHPADAPPVRAVVEVAGDQLVALQFEVVAICALLPRLPDAPLSLTLPALLVAAGYQMV